MVTHINPAMAAALDQNSAAAYAKQWVHFFSAPIWDFARAELNCSLVTEAARVTRNVLDKFPDEQSAFILLLLFHERAGLSRDELIGSVCSSEHRGGAVLSMLRLLPPEVLVATGVSNV